MDQLKAKLDDKSYRKLTANLITDEILKYLDGGDLTELGILEMGPRKIILNVISKITAQQEREIPKENENSEHEKTIQSILADEPKLQRVLKLLTAGSIPATNELLKMNRVLTKFYFERMILEEKRYPSWSEKQELAIKIIEAFPQLEKTRVSANAPREVNIPSAYV
ncbi:uncharacterized protein LOC134222231 [Armigeres subalbatus]|uniref:uncharacterized protein LOC134222231 n=1 Tax=Armigeres subalbatus TaxID=124917 RepID=UPI002ED65D6C